MISAKWRVLDEHGRVHQPPTPEAFDGYFSCAKGADGSNFETPRRAVLWWVCFRTSIDAAEIVAPFQRSMRERCSKTLDDLWERLRLMGEAEGGNGTGGEVTFVIDDAHGTETETWTADECDDALEGIRLAICAIDLMDATVETDDD